MLDFCKMDCDNVNSLAIGADFTKLFLPSEKDAGTKHSANFSLFNFINILSQTWPINFFQNLAKFI
jgi:hypothetical protein